MRTLAVVVVLVLVLAAGVLAGSWATAKTGKTVPILVAASVSPAAAQVSFADGFAPIVQSARAAVVNVSSSRIVRSPGQSSPFFSDPFFRQFFGNQFGRNQGPPSAQREQSLGSGVIVNGDGYILTNNHVINGAKDIKVLLGDKRQFTARVVGADQRTDLAVLKVDANNLPAIVFGDSTKMQVGNFVLAIGNPFGLNQTVTMGIVSATGRGGLGIEAYEDFIQTDAAINPGNSGGALIDGRGNLIGINTAILTENGGGNQGVGFAIPGNMARNIMDQIIKTGKVTRAYLGVALQPVTQDIAAAFHLQQTSGALISSVASDSPAAKSGLQMGDVITAVDGQKVDDDRALQLKIGGMSPGTNTKLTVARNGESRDISVQLGEMPANNAQASSPGAQNSPLRGISVTDLTPDILGQLSLPSNTKGAVVTGIDPASAAADAGLQPGDIIQEANHQPVSNAAAFNQAIQSAGNQPVLLLIDRKGQTLFLVVQPQ
jgi:serine protease Do